MGGFSGSTFGAAKSYTEERTKSGPQSLGYITNGGAVPTKRKDGSQIEEGDYLLPLPNSSFPFDISYYGGVIKFESKKSVATYIGDSFVVETASVQKTNETPISIKTLESPSGEASNQSEVNKEVVLEISSKESLDNKTANLGDVEDGDETSYPNAAAVKRGLAKKIDRTFKIGSLTLEKNITTDEVISLFKDVQREYKNVKIDCDNNELLNIVVSMFKSSEIFTSIPDKVQTEEFKLATLKAVRDAITKALQGAIILKGAKQTIADIEALTDMEVGDEWFCKENSHFFTYTEQDGWIDAGGTIDLSNYIQRSDIVDNLTTNDAQRPLSAAQGLKLKSEVDSKQDRIDIKIYNDALQELNPNITFRTKKIRTMLDTLYINIECDLPTPLTDCIENQKEIIKFPVLSDGYTYPSNLRININVPSGYHTCMAHKNAFYNSNGEFYVPSNIANGKRFLVQSVAKIDGAYDVNGKEIYIAEQNKSIQGNLLVNSEGSPNVKINTKEIVIGETTNQEVFVLSNDIGVGYVYVSKYYDSSGNAVTGNFYKLNRIIPKINLDYMYKCYLMNRQLDLVGRNLVVDSQGRICEFKINQSEESLAIKAVEGSVVSYFAGIDGEVTIEPIDFENTFNQIGVSFEPHEVSGENGETNIDYYSMITSGINLLSGFIIHESL